MSAARNAAIDAAVRGTLAAQFADFFRGKISREELEEFARRRANGIRANFTAAKHSVAVALHCKGCDGKVAINEAACINGTPYCPACAPRFRILPPARRGA